MSNAAPSRNPSPVNFTDLDACRLPGARCLAHLVRDEQGSRQPSVRTSHADRSTTRETSSISSTTPRTPSRETARMGGGESGSCFRDTSPLSGNASQRVDRPTAALSSKLSRARCGTATQLGIGESGTSRREGCVAASRRVWIGSKISVHGLRGCKERGSSSQLRGGHADVRRVALSYPSQTSPQGSQGLVSSSTCGVESRHASSSEGKPNFAMQRMGGGENPSGDREPSDKCAASASPSSAGPRRTNPSAPTAPVVSGRAQIGGPSAAGLRHCLSPLGGQRAVAVSSF